MSKFTPGPWKITRYQRASLCEESIEVRSLSGRTVCDMGDYPNDEDEANARLIAAAPDLLEEHRVWARLFGEALIAALQGDYSEVERLAKEAEIEFSGGFPRLKSAAIARAEGK